LLDAEVRLGVPLGAVVTGHLLALDHARRVGAGSDGAGPTVLGVAVGVRTSAEAPALDHALEAAALGRAGHLDLLAGREDLDRDAVADGVRRDLRVLARSVVQPEVAQHARRRLEPGLGRVPDLRLVGAAPA